MLVTVHFSFMPILTLRGQVIHQIGALSLVIVFFLAPLL
jgi:hypothetical protein